MSHGQTQQQRVLLLACMCMDCDVVVLQTISFIIGLLPYLYMPFATARNLSGSWGDASTLQGFWTHLSRLASSKKKTCCVSIASPSCYLDGSDALWLIVIFLALLWQDNTFSDVAFAQGRVRELPSVCRCRRTGQSYANRARALLRCSANGK